MSGVSEIKYLIKNYVDKEQCNTEEISPYRIVVKKQNKEMIQLFNCTPWKKLDHNSDYDVNYEVDEYLFSP